MAEIRLATHDDVPEMIALGEKFYNATGLSDFVPYNHVSTRFLFEAHLNLPETCRIFLLVQNEEIIGGIGGELSPYVYNFDFFSVFEKFWFVHPDRRGIVQAIRLIERLEKWAFDEAGAVTVHMGAFAHLKAAELEHLYLRLGYRKLETTYVKGRC